jgi:hypothetical protein
MAPTPTGLQTAVRRLDQALDRPLDHAADPALDDAKRHAALARWRASVRKRMALLRQSLDVETPPPTECWLAPRRGAVLRERRALLRRLSEFGPRMQQAGEVEGLRHELKRLLTDVNHHLQHLHDLAYDDVELELGGSE